MDAQEARDNVDDMQEKYVGHTKAWERMLEYQKGHIAKREMGRRRVREQREREEKERMEEDKGKNGGGWWGIVAAASVEGID